MGSKLAGVGKWLRNFAIGDESGEVAGATMQGLDSNYEFMEPFALGAYETDETRRRSRIQIYTTWMQMQRDPTISAALTLHVTAALGGHESRGDTIFMTPADSIKNGGGKSRAAELRKMIETEAKLLVPHFNKIIFTACRKGAGFGDDFTRIYTEKRKGIVDLLCDDQTVAYRIQAFEQGSKTVGYHILEEHEWNRVITKLTTNQMARLKMPRITPVPQHPLLPGVQRRVLDIDNLSDLPIVPSKVGGSFLYDAEGAWRDVILNLSAMNSQQIADAVKQAFLTINMSGMPPEQRKKYRQGLTKVLQKHKDTVKAALEGGEAVWATQYHILPTFDEKQVLNPVGELAQRSGQISTDVFMTNVRRMTGALGMDMSLLGWADMLAGGLGDGAAFHTSAQVMQRSILIRQSVMEFLNEMVNLHFGMKYGQQFDPMDLPWKFDFYSDMSAASTEALTNRQTRMNSLAMTAQALGALKDIGLKGDSVIMLLEDIGGLDTDKAKMLADGLEQAQKEAQEAAMAGNGRPGGDMGGEGGGDGQGGGDDTGDGNLLNSEDDAGGDE